MTKTAFYRVWLIIAIAVVGFICGAEYGTPVFDITEIVWVPVTYRLKALDGVECYFAPPNFQEE